MVFQKKSDAPTRGRPTAKDVFYAVTFETGLYAPLTLTGTVCASNPARIVYLAVKDAKLKAKGVRWTSLAVLVDKSGPVGPQSAGGR